MVTWLSAAWSQLVPAIRQRLRPEPAEAQSPLRVLIVDDEAPIRQFVARVLAAEGVMTWCAPDAAEALRMVPEIGTLDLLLTDLLMPSMNGDELARRLRLRDPDLKILYLTGFSDRLFTERILLWENEAFLEKPCTIDGLLQAVYLATHGHATLLNRPVSRIQMDPCVSE